MDPNVKNRLIKKYATLGILLLTLALPIALYQVRQNQDNRSSAAAADKLEVEGGTLGGNTNIQSDSTASGGSYVLLGKNLKSVNVSSISSLKTALTDDTVDEIIVANGTYRISPASYQASDSLWIGSQFTSRTRPVIVRAQTKGGVTFDGGGTTYFGCISFEDGAHDQTWVGFNCANGQATDTGIITFGGYAGKLAPHHITMRNISILASCTGRTTTATDHAFYISQAVGGPHDLLFEDINVDGAGLLTSAFHFYHSDASNKNGWNITVKRLNVTGTSQAIMIWDSTINNLTFDTATINNPTKFAVRYEAGSNITLANITSTSSFYSSLGANPPDVTFINNKWNQTTATPTPSIISGLKYPPDSTFISVTPSSLTRPGYLSPAIDPNFNTKITRVTDPSGFGGSTTIRHAYSKVAAWNKDGSKLMMGKYILDGKTYTVIKNITSLTGEYRWSNTDPNKIYVIEGDGEFRIWDVNTVTNNLIRSFPGFDEVRMGPWEGNLSSDDSMVVLSGKNGTDYTAIVFDIKNNKEISRKTFPGVWENGIDWASISPNGKYVVINHACGSPCIGPVKTYDLNLNYLVDIAPKGEHADMTTDIDGNDYLVYVLGQNGYITKSRVDTGVKTVVLQSSKGGHISCRNLQRPGWCYASLIGTGYNQAFAFKLDGSQIVQRFANHRSTNANYDVQPKGVVSTDGTKMLWTSDWGLTDGSWFDYVVEMP